MRNSMTCSRYSLVDINTNTSFLYCRLQRKKISNNTLFENERFFWACPVSIIIADETLGDENHRYILTQHCLYWFFFTDV